MTRRQYTWETAAGMGIDLPRDVRAYVQPILFALAMKIHRLLTDLTPVDTGYLRLTLSARVGESGGFAAPARDEAAVAGQYAKAWGAADSATADAIAAWKPGTAITFGYTAEYAPYVEDHQHMVKSAKDYLPMFLHQSIAEARQGIASAKAAASVGGA